VLFRLTEQEHRALEELCAEKGGRSLSEFVRVEVLNPAFSADFGSLRELATSLERRLSTMEEMHGELARRLQSPAASEPLKSSPATGGEA
jgi:hypothetical protein